MLPLPSLAMFRSLHAESALQRLVDIAVRHASHHHSDASDVSIASSGATEEVDDTAVANSESLKSVPNKGEGEWLILKHIPLALSKLVIGEIASTSAICVAVSQRQCTFHSVRVLHPYV